MNLIAKYAMTFAVLAAGFFSASAQDDGGGSSSSSSIVRRSGASGASRRGEQARQAGVTDRMQKHFSSESNVSDADRMWMRVIYRDLEVKNPKNAALYFPEEVIDGQENLFRILMRLLADNQVAAYEYLDGKEIFTDQYRLKVRDMLDRFHVMYSEAKGSTEKNPRFAIDESDVPANEVLSYYILEKWEFDSRTNKTRRVVEAICPVLHRSDDFGGDAVRYPMFWIRMNDIRPYLAQQYIFIDDDNNLPKYTYDDFFRMAMYDGDIYKTRNLTNRSMMQMFPDPDDRKRAQDSIQNRLDSFDKKLWVPSREEVIAAREARDAAEAAKAEAEANGADIKSRDGEEAAAAAPAEEKKSARSTRGRKSSGEAKAAPKKKTRKEAKPKAPKSSSSSAVRSVRRRK
ncbi:MAG: gliding motility protein GldN [Muribaculaceae bacterium]|nr:gliding motility protein GldN [Muribaculaceae bacterium]MDE7142906.1 gliding motility protein GldN [Muribaculaceae bacterium]